MHLQKTVTLSIMVCIPWTSLLSQPGSFSDTAAVYFREIEVAAATNEELWNLDLYGPLLLVDRESRRVFANFPDSAGMLQRDRSVYQGYLPTTVNVSNTSLFWSGRKWAMVMLPLPSNKERRLNLLAHELFHRVQPQLGFEAHNPNNDHLDKKEGRILLRLELEALKAALRIGTETEIKTCLVDALLFRKYRHLLYPGSDSTENMLELNEGLTEYTGVMMSGRNKTQMIEHFTESIGTFMKDPSYVRSFAYQTIPVYGYLLSQAMHDWNRTISPSTDLTGFFTRTFGVGVTGNLQERVAATTGRYNGAAIEREEIAREEEVKAVLRQYRRMFLEEPHLDISLERMNMSFEYQNITPLDDKGTVYPIIRIADVWGILDVKKGALMSPQWNKVTVSAPTSFQEDTVYGDGWQLTLNENFIVEQAGGSGNYLVIKK